MSEKTLSRQEVFRGELLSLEVQQVELIDGTTATRELVWHADAVCAVVLTPELDTVFVKQFRKPAESFLLEIPAGKIDPGESADTAVRRELDEEVGFESGEIVHLMDFYATPGFCNEKLSLYLALEANLGRQNLDEGEFIELLRVPFENAVDMAMAGQLGDSKSVAGILAAERYLRSRSS